MVYHTNKGMINIHERIQHPDLVLGNICRNTIGKHDDVISEHLGFYVRMNINGDLNKTYMVRGSFHRVFQVFIAVRHYLGVYEQNRQRYYATSP